ncbi:uncharacterized protein F5891DRAFT_995632 [Suillus fuscotomentosus]|uniref:Secreted protein n=1 Tax=Suillus fuscotomentosus TaxID=1912939 RepID=A0AAD4EQZ4_9AGAM|nr:uncharacterized protein F5891DRAFT_995632 [Suillus fuscotomentosus]KAG1908884.1 hypothetical protein F5891DRAFT_995632 [Suillus fuscotomentosus]
MLFHRFPFTCLCTLAHISAHSCSYLHTCAHLQLSLLICACLPLPLLSFAPGDYVPDSFALVCAPGRSCNLRASFFTYLCMYIIDKYPHIYLSVTTCALRLSLYVLAHICA